MVFCMGAVNVKECADHKDAEENPEEICILEKAEEDAGIFCVGNGNIRKQRKINAACENFSKNVQC